MNKTLVAAHIAGSPLSKAVDGSAEFHTVKDEFHTIARGQTWLFQPLPVSTVPNTGRNQSDSRYRGLDEEDTVTATIGCLACISFSTTVATDCIHYKRSSRRNTIDAETSYPISHFFFFFFFFRYCEHSNLSIIHRVIFRVFLL